MQMRSSVYFILLAGLALAGCRASGSDAENPVRQVAATSNLASRVASTQEGTDIRAVPIVPAAGPTERLLPGDELDAIELRVRPPARFAGHVPAFRVERRTFTFAHAAGRTETKHWQVLLDGARVVALLRSGDIQLIAPNPEQAATRLDMPTERYHLDNLLGPSLSIHQGCGTVWTHGSIYDEAAGSGATREHWEGDGRSITLVRQRDDESVRLTHRFTVTCDPIYGYRIDGEYRLAMREQPGPKQTFSSSTFCPGNYVPWPEAVRFDFTVFTPADAPVVRGWANNLLCMDRCDSDKAAFAWRDRGFIAYLAPDGGWSPVRTRVDGFGAIRMQLCNAHNDFHVNMPYPAVEPGPDGYRHWRLVHRLMWMPPEMAVAVREVTQLIQSEARGVIIRIGETEDFEDQPLPLTEPRRGLVWTSGEPPIVHGQARSGTRSLEIRGRQWPNLPQVSLRPGIPYRLEAWYKVRPFTAEELVAAQTREDAARAKAVTAGRTPAPATDWTKLSPRAWIAADTYEWSPYASPMIDRYRSSEATPGEWQRVVLDIDAPAWGPFLNIAFVCEGGVALLDDVRIAPR
jgi:hypothetical protein